MLHCTYICPKEFPLLSLRVLNCFDHDMIDEAYIEQIQTDTEEALLCSSYASPHRVTVSHMFMGSGSAITGASSTFENKHGTDRLSHLSCSCSFSSFTGAI